MCGISGRRITPEMSRGWVFIDIQHQQKTTVFQGLLIVNPRPDFPIISWEVSFDCSKKETGIMGRAGQETAWYGGKYGEHVICWPLL